MRSYPIGALFTVFASIAACSGAGRPSDVDNVDLTAATEDTAAAGECGDGELGPGELCDGDDLGGTSCPDVNAGYAGGTLACAADCRSFDASACDLSPGTALIALNEIGSGGALVGEWAGQGDLIELFNAGDVAADLSGYKLSDDMAFPADKTYVFPAGFVLAPGEWRVLIETDLLFGIAQNKEETVLLVDARGEVIDSVTFDGAIARASWCRVPDGNGAWAACDQTFGTANLAASGSCGDDEVNGIEECDGADLGGQTCEVFGFVGGALACTADCLRDTTACKSSSAVVINELESGQDDIELYNAGDTAIDVGGWILTDDPVGPDYDPATDLEKVVFAAPTTIVSEGFFVVTKGMGPGQHPFGLSGDGDTVTLLRPDLSVADRVSYTAGQADVSYCRLPDGPDGDWTPGCTPTQGAPNQGG